MRVAVVLFLLASTGVAGIRTGSYFLEGGPAAMASAPAASSRTDRELLQNTGFETGSIQPWVTSNWVVDTKYPHGGLYCACDVGNYSILQWVDTTPGTEVQSVTFWARQPDQPAAQAYDFFYSDGSYEEFVHFPTPAWQRFDVTYRVNRSKSLVGFGLWGYSGGGPGPDSTYIDDVSILVPGGIHDVGVVEILCPRDTIEFDTTHTPVCRIANYGDESEVVRTVMMIEDICDPDPYYWDTVESSLQPGDTGTVQFGLYRPNYPALHRVSAWTTLAADTNRHNDTLRQFFWPVGGQAIAGQEPAVAIAPLAATVTSAAGLRAVMARGDESVLDACGRQAAEPQPGVYFLRPLDGRSCRKVVVGR
jgi:hypothetical protein